MFAFGVLGAPGYLGYQNHRLKQEKMVIEKDFAKTKAEFAETSENLLSDIDLMKVEMRAMLNTMGALKKLNDTDRELLKKYSKVYFLNENYNPEYLISIPLQYVYESKKEKFISGEVWPFLQKLLDDTNTASGGRGG